MQVKAIEIEVDEQQRNRPGRLRLQVIIVPEENCTYGRVKQEGAISRSAKSYRVRNFKRIEKVIGSVSKMKDRIRDS